MLQERLNKIKGYFLSMEFMEDKWFISVKYKPKWGAYPSEDGKIQAVPDEKTPCVYWYYSNGAEQDVEEILDLIEETIETNLEAIKKVDLFKEKVAELQELFSDGSISYKQLETLKFDYNEEEPIVPKLPSSLKSVVKAAKKNNKKPQKQQKDKGATTYEIKSDSVSVSTTSSDEMPNDITSAKPEPTPTEDHVEVTSAINMSKEEIDDLRG